MSRNCRKFCGADDSGLCKDCLLAELPARKLVQELIRRNLVMVNKRTGTDRIESYFIWEQDLKEEKKYERN